ncbi:MAG TPA: hypothetical protein VFN49_04650, partial [Candidatus Aquilonibacter sp.]|nr:hypothetical protein [Candidatus Aquilonibacter sp.]
LYMPDIKFNRKIGAYAGKYFTVEGGDLTQEEWDAYAPSVLPTAQDEERLKDYFKDPSWIAPKGKNEAA